MKGGDKENASMTVTISKRLFSSTAEGDGQTTLGSPPPASKRLRVLPPFSEHLPSTHNLKTGSTAAGPGQSQQQQTHSSTQRKRRHDTEPGNGAAAAASPAGSGKRGKRDDGRPSNAAPSPNSAKTALEALLTCEGLERDADLQAEAAYINARVQGSAGRPSAAGTADAGDAADASSSGADATGSAAAAEPPAGAAAAAGRSIASGSSAVLDAARSSREKRRDQDQNPRARRASGSARNIRDQLASPASPDAPFEAAAAAADAEEHPDSPRPVSLELIGDKEWQRLFAVLTLSDTAAGRASSGAGSGAAQDQPGAAAAADDRSVGIRSHRLSRALHVSELPTAAASAAVVQEAPSTPARREGGSSGGSARCDVTPTRRSGFLAGEWQRVHQQRLGTPPAPQPAAAAHHAIAPFGSDCDMGF